MYKLLSRPLTHMVFLLIVKKISKLQSTYIVWDQKLAFQTTAILFAKQTKMTKDVPNRKKKEENSLPRTPACMYFFKGGW